MSEYIWVDKNGKIMKREPKGRGRPKAGSQVREDGNFYIITDGSSIISSPPAKKNTPAIPSDESEGEEDYSKLDGEQEEEIEDNVAPTKLDIGKLKCFREPNKIKLKDFLKCCFVDAKDFIIDNEKIILIDLILVGNPGLINLDFNSCYSKIEIDKKENTMKVWDTNNVWHNKETKEWSPNPRGPSFYIKDLFSSFEIDE